MGFSVGVVKLEGMFGDGLSLTCATLGGVVVIFHKCRLVAVEKHTQESNCVCISSVPELLDGWSSVPEHTMTNQRRGHRRSCSPAPGCTHAVVDLRVLF